MSRNEQGLRVSTNVFEAAAWHYRVKVMCGCGHAALFDPHGLWWLLQKRRWNDDFKEIRSRFYCTRCRTIKRQTVRPDTIGPSKEAATIMLPMPDEAEWKRALGRFRA